MLFGVEKIYLGMIALVDEHTRHGKGIATVVARPRKHNYTMCRKPALHNFFGNKRRRTLHEFPRRYAVALNGLAVDFAYVG